MEIVTCFQQTAPAGGQQEPTIQTLIDPESTNGSARKKNNISYLNTVFIFQVILNPSGAEETFDSRQSFSPAENVIARASITRVMLLNDFWFAFKTTNEKIIFTPHGNRGKSIICLQMRLPHCFLSFFFSSAKNLNFINSPNEFDDPSIDGSAHTLIHFQKPEIKEQTEISKKFKYLNTIHFR